MDQSDVHPAVSAAVTEAFRKVLHRHLYQSAHVELSKELDQACKDDVTINTGVTIFLFGPWIPIRSHEPIARPNPLVLYFSPPDLKLHCAFCGRCEPFNLKDVEKAPGFTWPFAVSKEGVIEHMQALILNTATFDTFVLTYLCQGCKRVPETFLVRRESTKLILCGRSPIETVEVPSFIPRKEADWYRGAVVAYQSGQELAALFLLRTFIEQFARRQTGETSRLPGDLLMGKYMELLPADFKARFPSLRVLYEDISAALHEADPSKAPFEEKRRDVNEHFEARRLYKIADSAKVAAPAAGIEGTSGE